MGYLIAIVVLFALMWLLLIRPQRRRQLAQQQLLSEVAPGDEILTAGGVYGRVREVGEEELTLEIAPGTSVRLDRRAVASRITPEIESGERISGGES